MALAPDVALDLVYGNLTALCTGKHDIDDPALALLRYLVDDRGRARPLSASDRSSLHHLMTYLITNDREAAYTKQAITTADLMSLWDDSFMEGVYRPLERLARTDWQLARWIFWTYLDANPALEAGLPGRAPTTPPPVMGRVYRVIFGSLGLRDLRLSGVIPRLIRDLMGTQSRSRMLTLDEPVEYLIVRNLLHSLTHSKSPSANYEILQSVQLLERDFLRYRNCERLVPYGHVRLLGYCRRLIEELIQGTSKSVSRVTGAQGIEIRRALEEAQLLLTRLDRCVAINWAHIDAPAVSGNTVAGYHRPNADFDVRHEFRHSVSPCHATIHRRGSFQVARSGCDLATYTCEVDGKLVDKTSTFFPRRIKSSTELLMIIDRALSEPLATHVTPDGYSQYISLTNYGIRDQKKTPLMIFGNVVEGVRVLNSAFAAHLVLNAQDKNLDGLLLTPDGKPVRLKLDRQKIDDHVLKRMDTVKVVDRAVAMVAQAQAKSAQSAKRTRDALQVLLEKLLRAHVATLTDPDEVHQPFCYPLDKDKHRAFVMLKVAALTGKPFSQVLSEACGSGPGSVSPTMDICDVLMVDTDLSKIAGDLVQPLLDKLAKLDEPVALEQLCPDAIWGIASQLRHAPPKPKEKDEYKG